ncbi:MAG TPA: hypothetical protein VFD30_03140 [Terriglobia bacterium]|nr:hypothetical protein [Terriglobia bacterium]
MKRIPSKGQRHMRPGAYQTVFLRPAFALAIVLAALALFASPRFVSLFVSLDWYLGDMHTTAYVLQATFAALFVIALLASRRINDWWFKTFPTRRHFIFALVALSASTACALLLVEAALRLLNLPFDEKWTPSENAIARFDPELGWSYIPLCSSVQEFGSQRRKVAMYFDSHGNRVGKPGVEPDPTLPTVCFAGDSFTFGHGLPYEETFVGQLSAMPDFPFQAVNLGVQAYGTDQSFLRLRREYDRFNTKGVVYTFVPWQAERNEVDDLRLFYPHNRMLGTKPQFALKRSGTLYLKRRPERFEDFFYSRVWACVRIAETRYGPKPNLALTRALVLAMKNFVESRGGVFVVVAWDQGQDPKLTPGRIVFEGLKLNVIDLGTNAPAGWNSWKIEGDGHPDARANSRVARLICEEFKRSFQEWQAARAGMRK